MTARPRTAFACSVTAAIVLCAAISLGSGVGLRWIGVLWVHAACSAALLGVLLRVVLGIARLLAGIDRRVDAIRGSAARATLGVVVATLAWVLLAAEAVGTRWELHAVRGAQASLMAVPHVLAPAWLALAPALVVCLTAALAPRRIALRMLALNHLLLAIAVTTWVTYHPGIRDRPFPAFCGRGQVVVPRDSGARYSLHCDSRGDACVWTEVRLGGTDTPGLIVRAELASGAVQSVPLRQHVPISMVVGPDGTVWAAGAMRGDEPIDLMTGMVEAFRTEPLERIGSFGLDYAPTWFEREPTTGRFFGAGLRGQEESVLTVHQPDGGVLTRVPMPTGGLPHLAATASGIAVAAGWEIAILDPDGRVIRRRDAPAVADVAYDAKRDALWMVSPTGRVLRVDVATLEQRESHRVPFGSRYVVVDAAHDRILVGNPVLPSIALLPLDAPAAGRIVTDVPVGVRAFSVAGDRVFYTCRCGIYELRPDEAGGRASGT